MQSIVEAYSNTMELGDPRVAEWPLMYSPVPTLALVASYICFIKVIGPAMMKNRPPYDLRVLMVTYNFAMVAYNGYLSLNIGRFGWFGNYSLGCQPVDYSNSYEATQMAELSWWFFMSKLLEFADTIFFVLRKKFNHITYLHLIHHSFVPLCVWAGTKYAPGGYNSFFPFLNTVVHTIMYLYYGLAALGPEVQPFLWWKKYITTIQMGQFVLAFIYTVNIWVRNCDHSTGFLMLNVFNSVFFWILFYNFYRTTYKSKKSASRPHTPEPLTSAYGFSDGLRERRPIQQELVHSYVQSPPVGL